MIAKLQTDERLIERMKASASQRITKDQLVRQRISFVYGNLPSDSNITRERVAEKLKKNEGVG